MKILVVQNNNNNNNNINNKNHEKSAGPQRWKKLIKEKSNLNGLEKWSISLNFCECSELFEDE